MSTRSARHYYKPERQTTSTWMALGERAPYRTPGQTLLTWTFTIHSAFCGSAWARHSCGLTQLLLSRNRSTCDCLQETLTRLGPRTFLLEVEEGLWFSSLKVCKYLIIAGVGATWLSCSKVTQAACGQTHIHSPVSNSSQTWEGLFCFVARW